ICAMPQRYFQLANLASAMIWAFGILAPGAFGLQWLAKWIG
ncbi:DedA family protein, partial [Proteus mirabilis]